MTNSPTPTIRRDEENDMEILAADETLFPNSFPWNDDECGDEDLHLSDGDEGPRDCCLQKDEDIPRDRSGL